MLPRVTLALLSSIASLALLGCGGSDTATGSGGGGGGGEASAEARCLAVVNAMAADSFVRNRVREECTAPGVPDEEGLEKAKQKCFEAARYAWNSSGVPDADAASEARARCEDAAAG